MKPKPGSKRARAFEMIDGGKSDAHIAKAIGWSVKTIRGERSRKRYYDRYLKEDRAAGMRKRREQGVPPVAQYRAEQKAAATKRRSEFEALIASGLSWRKAAKELGITVNVIAGLIHRERQRQ